MIIITSITSIVIITIIIQIIIMIIIIIMINCHFLPLGNVMTKNTKREKERKKCIKNINNYMQREINKRDGWKERRGKKERKQEIEKGKNR